jgi:hypothetical protein
MLFGEAVQVPPVRSTLAQAGVAPGKPGAQKTSAGFYVLVAIRQIECKITTAAPGSQRAPLNSFLRLFSGEPFLF